MNLSKEEKKKITGLTHTQLLALAEVIKGENLV